MSYAILAEGLVKRFGETTALDGVDLAVRSGTVLGVLGPNGAGKTTAVRILATLLRPDSGRATVGGYDVVRQAHQVRQMVGLTGQYASVDENLTGAENLLFIGRLLGISRADAKARARELLTTFNLADAADRAVKTYSGGMRRRLDLALSLVTRPEVIFLDEPTAGLDPRSRLAVWTMIKQLVGDGVTVFLTTQYLEEADRLADQVAVLDGGRIAAEGTPQKLKRLVPGGHLELTFATEDDFRAARDRIGGQAGELSLSVPSDGTGAHVKQILDALDGIEIAELSLRKPTLDDVFLQLTGGRTS